MIDKKTKVIPVVVSLLIFCAVYGVGGVLNIPNNPVPGDPRSPSQVRENNTAIENTVNGNIDSFNIEDGTIMDVDVAAAAGIVDTKLGCSGDWRLLSDCDSVIGNADAQHSHSGMSATSTVQATRVAIIDAGGYYSSSTVEGALQELGADVAQNAADIVTLQGQVSTSTTVITYGVVYDRAAQATGTLGAWWVNEAAHALPSGAGEVVGLRSYAGSAVNCALIYGVAYDMGSTATATMYIDRVSGNGTFHWMFFDGIKTFTIAGDANAECDGPTSTGANGGVVSSDGLCVLQKQVTAGTGKIFEIMTNCTGGQMNMGFFTTFFRSSNVTNVRPYWRY